MQPLAEILEQLDHPVLQREAHEKVKSDCGAVAGTLQALHSYDRQASVVGISSIGYTLHQWRTARELCQPQAFPQLKQWLQRRIGGQSPELSQGGLVFQALGRSCAPLS